MRLFDTHAHLDDERFDNDRESLITSLCDGGVELVMNVACSLPQAERVIATSNSHDFIYAACGIHPHSASDVEKGYLDALKPYLMQNKVMALGEIGLDYHYDFSPRETQKRVFAQQLELAAHCDMPVILHIREAFGDCMDILRAHRKDLKGVMHCFSGSVETMYECLDLGLYVAFGGSITFKNAKKNLEAAAKAPLDRIVIETDCPYLTPVPHRSERNDPRYTRLVVQKLADERGMDADEIAQITFDNGVKLFELEKHLNTCE